LVVVLVICLLMSVIPAFSAGKSESMKAGKEVHFVFVTPLIGHPAWLEAKRGAEDAAKKLGFQLSWVGPSGIDMDAQVQQIEIAIAQKVAGVFNCPLNPEAFLGVYAKAKEAGVPIINVQVDTPESTRLAFIGTGMVEYGQMAAEVLAKKMNGKTNIAVVQTSMDSGNQNAEFDAFKKVIDAKYPGMKVIVRETDQSDMVVAADKINAILSTYPQVDSLFCLEGSAAPAAARVLKERGLKDKVTVLGIDDMPETLGAIREKLIWGTLTQNYYFMGYQGSQMFLDHLAGKKVPSITDSGTTLVTLENVDTYKK
jgi:ABC-type sugar transport system substrate-binding protein